MYVYKYQSTPPPPGEYTSFFLQMEGQTPGEWRSLNKSDSVNN